ncbi:(2E,6E)-farnesyl diphosphate synthase [Thalassotalea sp. LPB0316]|uniref:(2E,6E)-farnesyl diphosphate synthase n=1 Tax=Thalassotalea sp. LPB0316 TaxID=2769490 RepID=UPI001867420C|nr:(2E,6E)-farnesyl diphosphate synthase [Thalassotalea sp. LPB0316]QOL26870.1 (2E,6E)-farnesyl diphosphate synthase [Thalassotalea sp. LPB0316]
MTPLPELEYYQDRINQFLKDKISAIAPNDKKLLDAMHYGLLLGGKRMRPYLVYTTGTTLDVSLDDLDGIAGALECIHAYSLIHDDLPAMDDDDLRRGQPTCHKAFDEATAILAGDALQTLAFDILVNHPFSERTKPAQLQLIQQLVSASGYQGMCGGQALDLSATDQSISLTELEHLHQLKTGALLKASVIMPALIAPNITLEHKKYLATFAECVGLAYQVQDDIIDITSSQEELGKPAGSDLAANKSTYPSLLGLDGAQAKAQDLLQQALQALDALPYNMQNLKAFAHFIVSRTH